MAIQSYEYLVDLTLDKTTNIYNIFISTYNGNQTSIGFFICERRHEMRLDLVCNELYNTTRYLGTLGKLNGIDNPFSIRQDDILLYPTSDEAEGLLKLPDAVKNTGITDVLSNLKSDLINELKKSKSDPSKTNYNNNRPDTDLLPPTINDSNVPDIVVENGLIRIAPNLYKQPITVTPADVPQAPRITPTSPQQTNPTSEESTTRILVKRYTIQKN